MRILYKYLIVSLLVTASACSLEEENPSGVTLDKVSTTVEGYNKLINSCYFDLPRYFYGRSLLYVTEGGTDIWTSSQNSTSQQQYLKYSSGGAMPLDMAKDFWNGAYDGINMANICIDRVDQVNKFASEEEKNAKVAEAHFLRALYYFHLVEQFGGVVMTVHETQEAATDAHRAEPLVIYESVIIPDLEFATEHLPATRPVAELGRPTKKSALGLLAKACLQTKGYGSDKFIDKALAASKKLIDDVVAGGVNYDAKLYSDYSSNFPVDVKTNDEALYLITYSQKYGSTQDYDHNNDYKKFYCYPDAFGAILADAAEKRKTGRWSGGDFMPSRYLLDLFVMPDGTLDPRYEKSFQTSWTSNKAYTWTVDALTQFDRTDNVTTSSKVAVGDVAIKFMRPENEGYDTEVAQKFDMPYMWVDINDVYDTKVVKMQYTYIKRNQAIVNNPFLKFYPSLTKFNNGSHFTNTSNTSRFTSDASAIVMRMGEIYLIAAEAEYYKNGATQAAVDYINVLRSRAYGSGKGQVSASDINIQFILDERARELCGEYTRWYDLKRTGKLSHTYLNDKNPDVGQYFMDGIHERRPIPLSQIDAITNPDGFQNPGY